MEADFPSIGCEAIVPRARGLLQPIDGAFKKAYMVGFGLVNEPGWLKHVHGLLEVTIQKRILDIKLMKRPVACDCNSEDCANRGGLDHRAECFVAVDAGLL